MYKNGEIEIVMSSFEKAAKSSMPVRCSGGFDKEEREIGQPFKQNAYYQNGETNQLFIAYLWGYSLGKFQ